MNQSVTGPGPIETIQKLVVLTFPFDKEESSRKREQRVIMIERGSLLGMSSPDSSGAIGGGTIY